MNNEYLELIEKYLENRLNEEEKKKVTDLMQSDEAFKHLFNQEALISNGITYAMLKNTQKELQLLEEELPSIIERSNRNIFTKNFYWSAVASIVIIFFSGYFLLKSPTLNGKALYTENFVPFPNEFYNAARGEEILTNQLKSKAFSFYTTKQYQKAIPVFDEVLSKEDDPVVLFYKANALLAIEDFYGAITVFNAYNKKGKLFENETSWYLALAYLGINDIEKSKSLLQLLNKEGNIFAKDSNQLLKQLE